MNYIKLNYRLLFTISIIIVYRLLIFIPLYNIDLLILNKIIFISTTRILNRFNLLHGGAIMKMSIISLNIMPYISSSVILHFLSVIFNDITELKKSGEIGREFINLYTKYIAIIISYLQGYNFIKYLEKISYRKICLVISKSYNIRVHNTCILVISSFIVIWLSELITSTNIINGSSAIIVISILSDMATEIISNINLFFYAKLLIVILLIIISLIMEKQNCYIYVHYIEKEVINYIEKNMHFAIKINITGIIPIIITNVLVAGVNYIVNNIKYSYIKIIFQKKMILIILNIISISYFIFFYIYIIVNIEEISDNLRKNSIIILKKKPGIDTTLYLKKVCSRMFLINTFYILLILLPTLLHKNIVNSINILLIINIFVEIIQQAQNNILYQKYITWIEK